MKKNVKLEISELLYDAYPIVNLHETQIEAISTIVSKYIKKSKKKKKKNKKARRRMQGNWMTGQRWTSTIV